MPIPRPAGIPRPAPTGSYKFGPIRRFIGYGLKMGTYDILLIIIDNRRRSFDAHADNRFATENHKAESPLDLLFGWCFCLPWLFLGSNAAEFLTVCQNQVHMPVEGKHLSGQSTTIVDSNSEPPVDEAEHLSTF